MRVSAERTRNTVDYNGRSRPKSAWCCKRLEEPGQPHGQQKQAGGFRTRNNPKKFEGEASAYN